MTLADALTELDSLGTPQTAERYRRQGMGGDMLGVPFSGLRALQKRIRRDHALARGLWATGIADARHLALLIGDPAETTIQELTAWAADLGYYLAADLLSSFAATTAFAQPLAEEWIESDSEWTGRAGWDTIGLLALRQARLPDGYFERLLERIERDIQGSKNFTRHAMNNALISIGMRNHHLKGLAQAAARRIGEVQVDHGETDCRTPDAVVYIERAYERRSRKKNASA